MGGDAHASVKIPDYKIYQVLNCPELEKVQDALEAKGLCDPWLRNEVWRYNKTQFPHHYKNLRTLLFTGFKFGLAAAIASILIQKAISKDEHDHHESAGPKC